MEKGGKREREEKKGLEDENGACWLLGVSCALVSEMLDLLVLRGCTLEFYR